jgi:glycosyltransferase involved in cell wall biosynthesis
MNRPQPLVSVAMPVYNAEKYLKQAIDSVLSQTYTHFELILVNDASSDRSKEIIHSYTDTRIRYFENAINLGITKTRNMCVQHAAGKYVAVLDNDDIALPSRLEKQVEFLEANTQYGVCGSFYDIINGDGHLVNKMTLPVTDTEIRTYFLFENCFCNSSVMIQSILLKERNYSEGFNMIEDYYFLYMVSKSKKLSNLPLYTTQYRVHGKNTSLEKAEGMTILRRQMDAMILSDLDILYTEEEFELHTHFVTGNFHFFKTNSQIKGLENWLLKLYQLIKSKQLYDMGLVERVFIRRWLFLFSRTKRISAKIIFNRLFWKFKFKYIAQFIGVIKEKYSKVKSVS